MTIRTRLARLLAGRWLDSELARVHHEEHERWVAQGYHQGRLDAERERDLGIGEARR